jgi:hypothetical protein
MVAFQISINFHRGLREARNGDSIEFIQGPCCNRNDLVRIEAKIGQLISYACRSNEWQFLKTFVTNVERYISAIEQLVAA